MSTESNIQLTLGSLFDGSGGFPLGGLLTGCITPLWSSEVEPFAIPGHDQASAGGEALRGCVRHQRLRLAAGGYHHLRLTLSGYVHCR